MYALISRTAAVFVRIAALLQWLLWPAVFLVGVYWLNVGLGVTFEAPSTPARLQTLFGGFLILSSVMLGAVFPPSRAQGKRLVALSAFISEFEASEVTPDLPEPPLEDPQEVFLPFASLFDQLLWFERHARYDELRAVLSVYCTPESVRFLTLRDVLALDAMLGQFESYPGTGRRLYDVHRTGTLEIEGYLEVRGRFGREVCWWLGLDV